MNTLWKTMIIQVVYILENGISPNVANGLPLRQAVKEDNVKIIDLLMKNALT